MCAKCSVELGNIETPEAATRGVLWKKVLLEILQNSQENTFAKVSFNKVAGLRPATLLKKRLLHRCFPMNFVKFLRTTFLQNTSVLLLLDVVWDHSDIINLYY